MGVCCGHWWPTSSPATPNWSVLPVPVALGRARPAGFGLASSVREENTGCPIWRPAAWNALVGPVSPAPWHAGMQPCPLALVEVDLVAVEVFHQDAGAVGADFGFAVEIDAAPFQCSVLA